MRSIAAKRYLVGIPVPYLDRHGRRLGKRRTQKWTRKLMSEFTKLFGWATPVPAPGVNVVQGEDGPMTLFETGQTLVLSACDARRDFLRYRARLEQLATEMAQDLDQEAVFVLGCPSDSFLVELTEGAR